MRIPEFIEATNKAQTPDSVFDLFIQATSDLGMDRVFYADITITPEGEIADPPLMHNYPRAWTERYVELGYQHIDPVPKVCRVSRDPFRWDDVAGDRSFSEAERHCVVERRDFGLFNGVCIPVWGPFGQQSRFGLASSYPSIGLQPEGLDRLYLFAVQFKNAYSRLLEAVVPDSRQIRLTLREREVLSWCLKGKSSWSIGEILGITENSVNFHIKNTMRKLDCNSRIMCVLKAIRLGLILP